MVKCLSVWIQFSNLHLVFQDRGLDEQISGMNSDLLDSNDQYRVTDISVYLVQLCIFSSPSIGHFSVFGVNL